MSANSLYKSTYNSGLKSSLEHVEPVDALTDLLFVRSPSWFVIIFESSSAPAKYEGPLNTAFIIILPPGNLEGLLGVSFIPTKSELNIRNPSLEAMLSSLTL